MFRVTGTNGNTIFLNDGSKFKRSDLLKVPEATEYEGANPVRKQKDENTRLKQKENQEKEQALKEKREKGKPIINIVPLAQAPAPAPAPKKGGRPPSGKPLNPKFAHLRMAHGTGNQ